MSLKKNKIMKSVSGEAVFARCLSSLKDERVEASRSLSGPQGVKFSGDKAAFLEDIRKVEHSAVYLVYKATFSFGLIAVVKRIIALCFTA